MKFALFLSVFLFRLNIANAQDYNPLIVDLINQIPPGGQYAQNSAAAQALSKAITVKDGLVEVNPLVASPIYCSGATYLIFNQLLARLQQNGLSLPVGAAQAFLMKFQEDGTDSWGRWNANGPGTARLFYELELGRNFMNFSEARPGDFMKIFFTDHIGKLEHGHSVVYLGKVTKPDGEYVKYWSSNQPEGRSFRERPIADIKHAVFSRFENPENLAGVLNMPKEDRYLAEMLTRESSLEEMKQMIGVK